MPWTPGGGRPDSAWAGPGGRPDETGEVRRTKLEFETARYGGITLDGASTTRRPGAISLDYLTALTRGPDTEGVAGNLRYTRPWRVRDVAGSIRLARALADRSDWEAEVEVFSYVGAPVLELDCAFDQAGRPVVVAERATGAGGASEVWVYGYDPFAMDFTFTALGAGRTPRCLLDNARDTQDADVLVFYLVDSRDLLCYRQQRDRYATEYDTPLAGIADHFVEDVVKGTDNRIVVLLSRRLPDESYVLTRLASSLYPFFSDEEEDLLALACDLTAGDLQVAVIAYDRTADEPEAATLGCDLVAGASVLESSLIAVSDPTDPEATFFDDPGQMAWLADLVAAASSLELPVINYNRTADEPEQLQYGVSFGASSLVAIVLPYDRTADEPEQMQYALTIATGSLA